jgi:uncharacterized protein YqfB (UPF0267 family)
VLQLWTAQQVLQVSRNGNSIALCDVEVLAMPPVFPETWAARVARMRAGRHIIVSGLL